MQFDDLTSDNILLFAAKHYDTPNVLMSEFQDDMKRFNYLKRLFKKYKKIGEVKERLIINHIIVLCNVFGAEAATRMLFYKTSVSDYSTLKTYLVFLSVMPERVKGIKGKDIISSDIPIDMTIANVLRNIK